MTKPSAAFCRRILIAFGTAAALSLIAVTLPAEARHRHIIWTHGRHEHWHHHSRHFARYAFHYRHFRSSEAISHISAIVVDANTGRTLYARDEHAPHYPASLTKVMTLYLLFEQLEEGHLRLDSDIPISIHAARQKPTKLGLYPGDTISVEDAIKAIVTRSANDVAVAIAEAIAGDEERFAQLMTAKAHALGMGDTQFANASGLPNDDQTTTAHDLAILGQAVQDHFPRYFHYFSTHVFRYNGRAIANHNHLLDRVEGMDGIKTGYTRAAGFNLLSSVRRNGHHIVAVVLGGPSAAARDRMMAALIEDKIGLSATTRTAESLGAVRGNGSGSGDAESASLDSDNAEDRRRLARHSSPPQPAAEHSRGNDKIAEVITHSPYGSLVAMPESRSAAHGNWIIQIGATADATKAASLLARAKFQNAEMLTEAQAITEKVQKGTLTLYRARFTGLEADSAERACKTLKNSGFSCFAMRN